jgi:hypothetical protein
MYRQTIIKTYGSSHQWAFSKHADESFAPCMVFVTQGVRMNTVECWPWRTPATKLRSRASCLRLRGLVVIDLKSNGLVVIDLKSKAVKYRRTYNIRGKKKKPPNRLDLCVPDAWVSTRWRAPVGSHEGRALASAVARAAGGLGSWGLKGPESYVLFTFGLHAHWPCGRAESTCPSQRLLSMLTRHIPIQEPPCSSGSESLQRLCY